MYIILEWHTFSALCIIKQKTMKNFLLILSSLVVLSSFTMLAGIDDVISAIKSGNANNVSKYFDNTVEISLQGKSGSYSKSQGEIVLKDFFASNGIKKFTIIHAGNVGGAEFCIGKLETNKGNFRTTVNLKMKGDKQILQEIKFEN
jgi:hypothetical protein